MGTTATGAEWRICCECGDEFEVADDAPGNYCAEHEAEWAAETHGLEG